MKRVEQQYSEYVSCSGSLKSLSTICLLLGVVLSLAGCEEPAKPQIQTGQRSHFLEAISASARGEDDEYIAELNREARTMK